MKKKRLSQIFDFPLIFPFTAPPIEFSALGNGKSGGATSVLAFTKNPSRGAKTHIWTTGIRVGCYCTPSMAFTTDAMSRDPQIRYVAIFGSFWVVFRSKSLNEALVWGQKNRS